MSENVSLFLLVFLWASVKKNPLKNYTRKRKIKNYYSDEILFYLIIHNHLFIIFTIIHKNPNHLQWVEEFNVWMSILNLKMF